MIKCDQCFTNCPFRQKRETCAEKCMKIEACTKKPPDFVKCDACFQKCRPKRQYYTEEEINRICHKRCYDRGDRCSYRLGCARCMSSCRTGGFIHERQTHPIKRNTCDDNCTKSTPCTKVPPDTIKCNKCYEKCIHRKRDINFGLDPREE